MSRIEDAARELVSWDWAHLLIDHPDAEQVIADVRNLERALNEAEPSDKTLEELGEAALAAHEAWQVPRHPERAAAVNRLDEAVKAYARARKGER